MIDGQNDGDSTPLTVTSAASVFERLLSSEEEHPEPEKATPAGEQPQASDDTSVENEPADAEENESGESESDEGEESEQEEGDDEETEAEQTPEPRKYRVKVDGEETEVTEDELLKGYSRTADYTRKTQKLSEEKKAFETETVSVREERVQLANQLTQLRAAIEALTPAEPDWDTLRQENPEEFAVEWAAWQQHKERTAAISKKEQEALARVQADQAKHIDTYVRTEQQNLFEKMPAWKDETVRKKEVGAIAEFAKSFGYTESDLSDIVDHRVILLLNKARLYDEAQKQKPVVRQKIEAVKAATPGPAKKNTRQLSDREKRRQRLRKSGSVRDAAAVFETMLDD